MSSVHVIDVQKDSQSSLMSITTSCGHTSYGFSSTDEFLNQVATQTGCVLFVDHFGIQDELKSLLTGLQAKHVSETPPVLVVLKSRSVRFVVDAIRLGVYDVFAEDITVDSLCPKINQAIESVHQRSELEILLAGGKAKLASLDPSERDVLALVLSGLQNKQIVAALGLSRRTIEMRKSRILVKFDTKSFAQLIRLVSLVEFETGERITSRKSLPS